VGEPIFTVLIIGGRPLFKELAREFCRTQVGPSGASRVGWGRGVAPGRIPVFGNSTTNQAGSTRGAGFQTCRPADFPIGADPAGLETRDTADLEVCATKTGMRTSPRVGPLQRLPEFRRGIHLPPENPER
jgi:hypothetical protein